MSKRRSKPKLKTTSRVVTRRRSSQRSGKKATQVKKSKNAGSRQQMTSQRFSGLLVIIGALILIGSSIVYKAYGQLPVSSSLPTVDQTTFNPAFVPEQVTISSIIDVPIVVGDYVDEKWTDSKTEAIYYAGSATPLAGGNTIIYAHNTANLFGKLKQVKVGDVVALRLSDGTIRQYQVKSTQVVDPSNVEPLQPSQTEKLTLYTCAGWLDSQRLVVVAEPYLLKE